MSMNLILDKIDSILRNDEALLRLLYYKSRYYDDDVLIKTDDRPNVLDLKDKTKILNLRLKYTPATNDLAETQICRIIFYPSPRKPQSHSYAVASQHINFDVFVHQEYNDIDMRLSKICDRINDIFSQKQTAGLGDSEFVGGKPFTFPDRGYIGYTMTYSFGSVNSK